MQRAQLWIAKRAVGSGNYELNAITSGHSIDEAGGSLGKSRQLLRLCVSRQRAGGMMKPSATGQAHKDGTLPYVPPAPKGDGRHRGCQPGGWCSVDVCAVLKESGDGGQEGETARRQHVWAEQPTTKFMN
ncbi:hypothetical protein llap_16878 [Limosa lapponica baueri]|uniref:Uncharacterized protein n=1 Tax=Limosa lapponica baueri TaxID=1758121 RepID=A0A2I0TG85_LIMLA|nr:hypothetical protein llap_16878 [Limosa lapponica baueri]